MAAAKGGRALRTETVTAPAWSDEPFQMREPRVADYLATVNMANDQEKAIAMLAAMVLGEDGKPVGKEAILNAPLAALGQLSRLIPRMTGEAEPEAPLPLPSDSATE